MILLSGFLMIIYSVLKIGGSYTCPSRCICSEAPTGGTEVNCSGNQMYGLPKLPAFNITSLDISDNSITYIQDYEFLHWSSRLTFLSLNTNYIKIIEKKLFWPISQVLQILIDNNFITEVHPLAFSNNLNLYKLTLNENPLQLPENSSFLYSPSLTWLELKKCNISYLLTKVFVGLTNLAVLKLSYNEITSLESNTFFDLKRLRYLHLEGNKIVRLDAKTFKRNHHLQWLYLNLNPLEDIKNGTFLYSSSLLLLDLSYCSLSQLSSDVFSDMKRLKNLKLNDNKFTKFEMSYLPDSLEYLDLSGNHLLTLNTSRISKLNNPKVKYIDISDNNITCDCKAKELRLKCLEMNSTFGSMCGLSNFCPDLKFMNCEEETKSQNDTAFHAHPVEYDYVPTGNISSIPNGNEFDGYDYNLNENNISSDDISAKEEETKSQNNTSFHAHPVEYDYVPAGNISSILNGNDFDEYDYNLNENNIPSDDISAKEEESLKRKWNVVLYSCIAVFGSLCGIGAVALAVNIFLHFRHSRSISSSCSLSSSLRHVRLQLMEHDEERVESRPLSFHQGFDFVSMPINHVKVLLPHENARFQPGIRRYSSYMNSNL